MDALSALGSARSCTVGPSRRPTDWTARARRWCHWMVMIKGTRRPLSDHTELNHTVGMGRAEIPGRLCAQESSRAHLGCLSSWC